MAGVGDGLEEEDYECLAWLAVLCWLGIFGEWGKNRRASELHSTVQRTQQKAVTYDFFFIKIYLFI